MGYPLSYKCLTLFGLLCLALPAWAEGEAKPSMPRVGQPAPEFALKDANGKTVHLKKARRRQWVVLYFFPKAMTAGWTKEACSFRDSYKELRKLKAEVLGVSTDDIAAQKQFTEKEKLNFRLLSDADKKVSAAYGVLMENGFARRVTFIIDPKGVIRHIFENVDVTQHSQEVADTLKELQGKKT